MPAINRPSGDHATFEQVLSRAGSVVICVATPPRAGTGWPLDTAVLQRELEAVVANVEGVRFVDELSDPIHSADS